MQFLVILFYVFMFMRCICAANNSSAYTIFESIDYYMRTALPMSGCIVDWDYVMHALFSISLMIRRCAMLCLHCSTFWTQCDKICFVFCYEQYEITVCSFAVVKYEKLHEIWNCCSMTILYVYSSVVAGVWILVCYVSYSGGFSSGRDMFAYFLHLFLIFNMF